MIEMLEGNAFHLATDGTSYVICITDTGHAEHIYYGKKLRDVRASLTDLLRNDFNLHSVKNFYSHFCSDLL